MNIFLNNMCFLSPLIVMKSTHTLIMKINCPKKCVFKSFFGEKICISSFALAYASCKITNKNIKVKISGGTIKYDNDYIESLANIIYSIRFKNPTYFHEIINKCKYSNDIFAQAILDIVSLYPNIGTLYYDIHVLDELSNLIKKCDILPNYIKKFIKKINKKYYKSISKDFPYNETYESSLINDTSVTNLNFSCKKHSYIINDIFMVTLIHENSSFNPTYYVNYKPELHQLLPTLWSTSTFISLKKLSSIGIGHGFLSKIITKRQRLAFNFLKKYFPEFPGEVLGKIAFLAGFDSIGFLKIAPFLLDDNVEEFFIDRPNSPIYIDHSKWGRCKSNILITSNDINRILTQLKAESGLRLDMLSPSLKTDIITKIFHVRVSADISPLTVDGPSIIFRCFKRKPLTIIDLINNGTLSIKAAAYLIFCLFHRRNIMAIGEPASGKTTLINALDMITPPHWRKISIESAVESIRQVNLEHYQVRYRVDPFESSKPLRRKYTEVIKLLHRSPNFIFLGELLTHEHVKALFYALLSGLKGLETCHASSLKALILKWTLYYKIPWFYLPELDVVIQMKRILLPLVNKRLVWRISEIELIESNDYDHVKMHNFPQAFRILDIFKYDSINGLSPTVNLYETPVLKKIRDEEYLTKENFYSELNFYEKIINLLIKNKISDNKTIIKVFAKAFLLSKNRNFNLKEVLSIVHSLKSV